MMVVAFFIGSGQVALAGGGPSGWFKLARIEGDFLVKCDIYEGLAWATSEIPQSYRVDVFEETSYGKGIPGWKGVLVLYPQALKAPLADLTAVVVPECDFSISRWADFDSGNTGSERIRLTSTLDNDNILINNASRVVWEKLEMQALRVADFCPNSIRNTRPNCILGY